MEYLRVSGIYPHLAVTHQEPTFSRGECGIGAVVRWENRLFWITYPANAERGGPGRIYSMDQTMERVECPQSTGGTHADRMIHRPSGALILGANVFFPDGTVRAFDVKRLVGRLTGAAAHPKAEEGWIYLASMEDGLYEVNIYSSEIRTLRKDIIDRKYIPGFRPTDSQEINKLPGDHGKGLYSGQGVVVYSNNGHGGVLAEWDQHGDSQDKTNWRTIERAAFTEITGPDGIMGGQSEQAPIWALGWDKRSVLLCVREGGQWTRFRLPKASYTQDADHGWYTEWPRIRKVSGNYLMCMHGMLYAFPETFRRSCAGGIRPLTRHLKMIADFEDWNGEIAFACDDASCFDNPTLGRSQSNLWFSGWEELMRISAPSAWGGMYVHEPVTEAQPSDPYFVGGFEQRILYLDVQYERAGFMIEMDRDGSGNWQPVTEVIVEANQCRFIELPSEAEWIRLIPDRDLSLCTAYVYLAMKHDTPADEQLIKGLLKHADDADASSGRLINLDGSDMKLGYVSNEGYYEADAQLRWTKKEIPEEVLQKLGSAEPNQVEPRFCLTEHSVLVITPEGARYHLPYLPGRHETQLYVREVVTERSLMNLCGTIYELPRPGSGGVRRIKPVTTHDCAIRDFISWRGMLVMSGVDRASDGKHIFHTQDGKAAVWCGNVDDLWRLGAPRGEGGPLKRTPMHAGEASDPFLLAGYRHKKLFLCHNQASPVSFIMDVDFAGTGDFIPYQTFEVAAGQGLEVALDDSFVSHWVRFRPQKSCLATALFTLWCE